jgi:bacillithiol system protein YtxJ
MHPDLTHLHRIEELEALLAESKDRPLLLFKHSMSCGVSYEALDELIDHLNSTPPRKLRAAATSVEDRLPARYAIITVQTHRDLSTAVARRLGVRHETPQALLIREGRVVWSASHFRVTGGALEAAIRKQIAGAR